MSQHPGHLIAKLLKERRIRQLIMAQRLQMSHSQLNEILKGKRRLTAKVAVEIEYMLLTKGQARQWLVQQVDHDIYMLTATEL